MNCGRAARCNISLTARDISCARKAHALLPASPSPSRGAAASACVLHRPVHRRAATAARCPPPTASTSDRDAQTIVMRHQGHVYLREVRAHVARALARPAAVRRARRSDQDLAPDHLEPVRPIAPALGHRVRGVGPGRLTRRVRAARRHRDRRRYRRDVRQKSLERRVRHRRRVRRSRRTSGVVDGRPEGIPRPRRHARSSRRPRGRGAALESCRRRARSLRRARARVEIPANGVTEIVVFLRRAATKDDARSLIERYRAADLGAVLAAVSRGWDDVLDTVQVKTPDRAMDVLLNRWLLYQTLVCRVWARPRVVSSQRRVRFRDRSAGRHGPGVSKPQLTRAHPAGGLAAVRRGRRAAHWWLPPSGQSVRTRISDDRIWLPYVTAHYVEVTGDEACSTR